MIKKKKTTVPILKNQTKNSTGATSLKLKDLISEDNLQIVTKDQQTTANQGMTNMEPATEMIHFL